MSQLVNSPFSGQLQKEALGNQDFAHCTLPSEYEQEKLMPGDKPKFRGIPKKKVAKPKPEIEGEMSEGEYREMVVSYLAQILEELKDLNRGMSDVMQHTEHLEHVSDFSEQMVELLENIESASGKSKKTR
ncbi:MAG: hypothetical protein C0478_16075 [Planctomyces sp.]|nr:hypothetical protein [Planctomyces sp.]